MGVISILGVKSKVTMLGNIANLKQKTSLSRQEKDEIDAEVNKLLEEKELAEVAKFLPQKLKASWKSLFGPEYDTVIEYSFRPLPKVVRVNTLKITVKDFEGVAEKYSWEIEPIKFFPSAFTIKDGSKNIERVDEYQKGFFYTQQVASMLPVIAVNPRPGEIILDIGAAPGSKTTQAAQVMGNKGEIVAVDISEERMEVLKDALIRLGITNVKSLVKDGTRLGKEFVEKFDKVLLDGPCSCEGIIRYKAHKFIEWSPKLVEDSSILQKKLIESAFRALKPEGLFVYSTCTYNPQENEAVIDHLLKKGVRAKIIPISFGGLKIRSGLTKFGRMRFDETLTLAARIYPQDLNSTGFFICKIQKLQM